MFPTNRLKHNARLCTAESQVREVIYRMRNASLLIARAICHSRKRKVISTYHKFHRYKYMKLSHSFKLQCAATKFYIYIHLHLNAYTFQNGPFYGRGPRTRRWLERSTLKAGSSDSSAEQNHDSNGLCLWYRRSSHLVLSIFIFVVYLLLY